MVFIEFSTACLGFLMGLYRVFIVVLVFLIVSFSSHQSAAAQLRFGQKNMPLEGALMVLKMPSPTKQKPQENIYLYI